MRKLIFMALGLVALAGAAYLVVYQRAFLFSMFNAGRGYPAAKTPQEAVDGFKKAIKARDYDVAADVYLTGDYAEQMKKAAPAATALGNSIDALLHQMNNKGFDSDKAKFLLALMEPLPTEFTQELTKVSDTESTFKLVEDKNLGLKNDPTWSGTSLDTRFYRALCGGAAPATIAGKAVLVGEKDKAFRLDVRPLPPSLRASVDRLVDKYKTYVLVIDKMKMAVRNDPMTKADFEDKLKQELERAKE